MSEETIQPYLYICPDEECEYHINALPFRFKVGQRVTSTEHPGKVGTVQGPVCPLCEKTMELLVDGEAKPSAVKDR